MRPLGAKYSPAPWVGNNYTEKMERILKELDELGLTIKKTEDGNYILKEKEEK